MPEPSEKKEVTPSESVVKKEVPVEEGKVTLDAEQYSGLLDRLAELEAIAAKPRKGEETVDLDTLAKEGKRGKEKEEVEIPTNLDEMTNTQVVEYAVGLVNKQGGERLQRLEVTVETLRVLREIDKGERDHEDFWTYEPEIKRIAMANPTLSVEDAYQLAKLKAPAKKEKGEEKEETTTQTERLLKLPKRIPSGEKPHVAPGSTKPGEKGIGLRESALKAWDEVVGKGKTQID